jgi:hypothetical protein
MIESPQHHGDLLRLVAQLRAKREAEPHKAAECDLLLAKLTPHVDLPTLPASGSCRTESRPPAPKTAAGTMHLIPAVA